MLLSNEEVLTKIYDALFQAGSVKKPVVFVKGGTQQLTTL